MDTYACYRVISPFTGQREITDELRAAAATLAELIGGRFQGCLWLLGVAGKIPALIAADARLQAYLQQVRGYISKMLDDVIAIAKKTPKK